MADCGRRRGQTDRDRGIYQCAVGQLVHGSATLGAKLGDAGLVPAVPGVRLVLIVLTAALAGLLASVLPGRRAARTPPVAAMAAT